MSMSTISLPSSINDWIKEIQPDIAAAIHYGLEFLGQARSPQGQWRDFCLAPGLSDEWVTGYVGAAVAEINDPLAWNMAFQAWRWLSQRQSEGGWGYNVLVPRDADSTIWALQLAQSLGCGDWAPSRRARAWLRHHVQKNKGIATYTPESPIREFIQASKTDSLAGWTQSHVCVTAAAAQLAPFRLEACDFLRTRQEADGRWASYWWCEDEYATSLAASALVSVGNLGDGDRIYQAMQWGQHQVQANGAVVTMTCPEGSSFATALVLYLLATVSLTDEHKDNDHRFDAIVKIVRWLLEHQQLDGSWSSSAALRVPPPNVLSPESVQDWILSGKIKKAIVLDQQNIFTTATVLKSVCQLQRAMNRFTH